MTSSFEGFTLGGLDLNDGVTYLLTEFSPGTAKKKPIMVSGADSDGAELADEARYENRVVTGKVIILPQASQDLALAAIGALTDKLQEADRGGVDAVWTPNDGTKTATLNVLLAEMDELPVTITDGWLAKSPTVGFSLTCRPFMRGTTVSSYVNLIGNPSFETNTTGWSTTLPAWYLNSGSTLTRVTAQHQDRTAAGQVVTTAATASQGIAYNLGVLPAGSYTWAPYIKGNAGGETLEVYGGLASAAQVGVSVTATTGWVRSPAVTFVADGVGICYAVVRTASAAVRTFFVDACLLVAGTTLPAYFDGATGTGYVWTGTADASTSAGPNAVVSSLPLVTMEIASVAGDVPADSTLIVTDSATQSRRHLRRGIEAQSYNPATSLLIDSANLTALSPFATATRSGAYSGGTNNVISGTLRTQLQSICTTGVQAHVGTFRVFARVYVSAITLAVALAWQVGDAQARTNYPFVQPVGVGWNDMDLGLVTIRPADVGSQKWLGRIDAYSTSANGGETCEVDYLALLPAREGYAKASTPYHYTPGALAGYDDWNNDSGVALNALVAPLGGTWATSGAAGDFSGVGVVGAGIAYPFTGMGRQSASDGSGRLALLGATVYAATEVSIDIPYTTVAAGLANPQMTLVSRYVNSTNYLGLVFTGGALTFQAVVAGSTVASQTATIPWTTTTPIRLRVVALASGLAFATASLATGGGPLAVLSIQNSALATGGAIDDGQIGFSDFNPTASGTSTVRYYDNFYGATAAAEDIAVYSGRSLYDTSSAMRRQDAAGTYYGDLTPVGGRFRLRPDGGVGRKNRVAVMARRFDVDATLDEFIADSLTLQASWTPLYLNAPR